jgi:hypothetical protein
MVVVAVMLAAVDVLASMIVAACVRVPIVIEPAGFITSAIVVAVVVMVVGRVIPTRKCAVITCAHATPPTG